MISIQFFHELYLLLSVSHLALSNNFMFLHYFQISGCVIHTKENRFVFAFPVLLNLYWLTWEHCGVSVHALDS